MWGDKMKDELIILSVDALYDGYRWNWNTWYKVGTVPKDKFEKINTTRKLLKYMREEGYLSEYSKCGLS